MSKIFPVLGVRYSCIQGGFMHIQCSKKGPGPEFPPNVTNPTFFIPVYYHQSSQINLTHINRKKVFLQVSGRKVSFFGHCKKVILLLSGDNQYFTSEFMSPWSPLSGERN